MKQPLFAMLLALVLAACGPAEPPPAPQPKFLATDITGVPWGRDFRLYDHHGRLRTLADFRGKVVAVFFGYTHCPDVCPTTLSDFAMAMRELGKDAEKVQVLFVTVDPERDTPEMLARYVPSFNPGFLGMYTDAASSPSWRRSSRWSIRRTLSKVRQATSSTTAQAPMCLIHKEDCACTSPTAAGRRRLPRICAPCLRRTSAQKWCTEIKSCRPAPPSVTMPRLFFQHIWVF